MVAVGHWNLTYYWHLEASGSLNNLQKWKVTALLFWGRGILETPLFCFTFQRQYLMCVLFISQSIPTTKLDCVKKKVDTCMSVCIALNETRTKRFAVLVVSRRCTEPSFLRTDTLLKPSTDLLHQSLLSTLNLWTDGLSAQMLSFFENVLLYSELYFT